MKQKKSSKISKKILSDKIADALTVKPRADIEDDEIFHTKPSTVTRADFSSSDSEDEAAISDFRKRSVNLLSDISKKYEGHVVSRKELEEHSSDDDSLLEENTRFNDTNVAKIAENVDYSSSNENEDENDVCNIIKKHKSSSSDDEKSGSEEEDEESEGEGYDISQMSEPVIENFEHVKKQNISEEAKKGKCVRNQLLLWEGLLEMRIHLQRCMNTANRMPMFDTYEDLKKSDEFVNESTNTIVNVANVLDKFLNLQQLLLKHFPETKSLANNKQTPEANQATNDSDEEIPSDTDNEEIPSDTEGEEESETKQNSKQKSTNKQSNKKRKLVEYESDISTLHKAFKSFRDTTIQKWNEKTRIATAANIKNTPTNTILQQVSYILSDRNKLIRKTQLKRSEYDIIGYEKDSIDDNKNGTNDDVNPITRDRKENDEYIPEIFDDNDFYHQLLRELIECKSADISDPIQLSRQWIALQQMRSKMKRKVDTRATKGRKIKYVVHNKLVSYMAPERSLKWNEESTNELYSSLFGKMFEHNVGVNVNLENVKIKD